MQVHTGAHAGLGGVRVAHGGVDGDDVLAGQLVGELHPHGHVHRGADGGAGEGALQAGRRRIRGVASIIIVEPSSVNTEKERIAAPGLTLHAHVRACVRATHAVGEQGRGRQVWVQLLACGDHGDGVLVRQNGGPIFAQHYLGRGDGRRAQLLLELLHAHLVLRLAGALAADALPLGHLHMCLREEETK